MARRLRRARATSHGLREKRSDEWDRHDGQQPLPPPRLAGLATASLVLGILAVTAFSVLAGFPVSACTDVTGFGLGGHAGHVGDYAAVIARVAVASLRPWRRYFLAKISF